MFLVAVQLRQRHNANRERESLGIISCEPAAHQNESFALLIVVVGNIACSSANYEGILQQLHRGCGMQSYQVPLAW